MKVKNWKPISSSHSKFPHQSVFTSKQMTKNIDHMEQQEEEKIPETHLS
jgi:hypothetical protein